AGWRSERHDVRGHRASDRLDRRAGGLLWGAGRDRPDRRRGSWVWTVVAWKASTNRADLLQGVAKGPAVHLRARRLGVRLLRGKERSTRVRPCGSAFARRYEREAQSRDSMPPLQSI